MQLTTFLTVLPLLAVVLAAPAPVPSDTPTTLSTSHHPKATHHGKGKHVQKNTCAYHEKDDKFHFHILGLEDVDQNTLETDLKTCGGLADIKFKHLSKKHHKHNWETHANTPNKIEDANCVADQLNKVIPGGNNGTKIECKEHKKGKKHH